jgi:hypothetical protein
MENGEVSIEFKLLPQSASGLAEMYSKVLDLNAAVTPSDVFLDLSSTSHFSGDTQAIIRKVLL